MARFLFATHPAQGHLNPLLAIARELRSQGHEVAFTASVSRPLRGVLREAGFPLEAIRPSPTAIAHLAVPLFSGFTETAVALRAFFASSAHYARRIAKLIDRIRPDAVVADFSFPGASLGAQLAGAPEAVVAPRKNERGFQVDRRAGCCRSPPSRRSPRRGPTPWRALEWASGRTHLRPRGERVRAARKTAAVRSRRTGR